LQRFTISVKQIIMGLEEAIETLSNPIIRFALTKKELEALPIVLGAASFVLDKIKEENNGKLE
jgi:hypothetical protein